MPNTASIRLKQRKVASDKRGWEVGSSALGIGTPPTLLKTISEKTTPYTIINGIKKDDRDLVVVQNTLGGIGRFRSQFTAGSGGGVKSDRFYITKPLSAGESVSYDVSVSFDVDGILYDELISIGSSDPALVEDLLKASLAIIYGVNPEDITITSYAFNSIDIEFNCRGDSNKITPEFLNNIDKTHARNSLISAANSSAFSSTIWLPNDILVNNIGLNVLKTEWVGSVEPQGPYGKYTGFSSSITEAAAPFFLLYGLSFGNTTQNNTHNNIFISYILCHKCGDEVDIYFGFKDSNYFIKTNPQEWEVRIYTENSTSEWVPFIAIGIGTGAQSETTMLKAASADVNFVLILMSKIPYNYVFRKV